MNASTHILLILFVIFLLACFVSIAFMFVSLAKKGDERRQMIITKASTWSFLVVMGSIVIRIIMRLAGISQDGNYISALFSTLIAGSAVFLVSLMYYRKRYGG